MTYIGTFVRIDQGEPESMAVAHRYVDGVLTERIFPLTESGAKLFVRTMMFALSIPIRWS